MKAQRVLGILWNLAEDSISFQVALNFSKKRRGVRVGPNILSSEVDSSLPSTLTRRSVLEQVMGIFDPLGLLSPFLLSAKIYLRETWSNQLGWDEAIPPVLDLKWRQFFKHLFEIENLMFPRCLKPLDSVIQN